jgi:hypothetical protein
VSDQGIRRPGSVACEGYAYGAAALRKEAESLKIRPNAGMESLQRRPVAFQQNISISSIWRILQSILAQSSQCYCAGSVANRASHRLQMT